MIPRYKDIMELVKKGATLEAQEKIMELREAATELQDENQELKQRVKELEEQLAIQGNLEYEQPYYWLKQGDGRDGPFCQLCWDKEKQLIRLQDANRGRWKCLSCNRTYRDSSYVSPRQSSSPPPPSSWVS